MAAAVLIIFRVAVGLTAGLRRAKIGGCSIARPPAEVFCDMARRWASQLFAIVKGE